MSRLSTEFAPDAMLHGDWSLGYGSGPLLTMSGGSTILRVDDEATPWLRYLATTFPNELGRALGYLGSQLRQRIKETIYAGGPLGQEWQSLADMTAKNSMQALLRNEWLPASGRWSKSKPRKASRKGGDMPYATKLQQAVRYSLDKQRLLLQVGWVSGSAGKFGRAVQGGLRGAKNSFSFAGRQPITEKMRRAFWAAGVPLSKSKRVLEQPERPLVRPVFFQVRPVLQEVLETRVLSYLNKSRGLR